MKNYNLIALLLLLTAIGWFIVVNQQRDLALRQIKQEDMENQKRLQEREKDVIEMEMQFADETGEFSRAYQIDPLLKEAYQAYSVFREDGKGRDNVISLFEQYLEKEPDSIFLPEIYYLMGNVFVAFVGKNDQLVDFGKMREYYLKAHKEYDGKFCSGANLVFNRLTFTPGTLKSRLEYYDWLLDLGKNGNGDSMHPVRSISQCIEGYNPLSSKEQQEEAFEWFKKVNLPDAISLTERQIYQDSFQRGRNIYEDLAIIARLYPDTDLGKQAQLKIDEADKALVK